MNSSAEKCLHRSKTVFVRFDQILYDFRAEIRSQKLGSTDIDERIRLDDKLRDMLKEQDATETELARHTLKHVSRVAANDHQVA